MRWQKAVDNDTRARVRVRVSMSIGGIHENFSSHFTSENGIAKPDLGKSSFNPELLPSFSLAWILPLLYTYNVYAIYF